MTISRADPDLQVLVEVSSALSREYVGSAANPWAGSPFAWILSRPSRQRGAIGEQLVAQWCAAKGADVRRTGDSDADRLINGHRIEIKLSTLWESGVYKFQQIRDQDYGYLLCLGISPFEAHCWVLPKPLLYTYVIGHMGQHTGSSGKDTAWLSFKAGAPYDWMRPYGGTLAEAWDVLAALGST
jgi:hypothetical protein